MIYGLTFFYTRAKLDLRSRHTALGLLLIAVTMPWLSLLAGTLHLPVRVLSASLAVLPALAGRPGPGKPAGHTA
ncbi:hypothetical protein [Deinococcus hopiensis]|uniref:Uncharacterized protein n=1 Tax=Deinococcus hopiensis KR-140 TaxID=695939 RepID=A0A1W1UE26_9DEIO|nr:hypothetical protein [Deinococcus hopiensis]SMB79293.1 hypothetical protein SAMN00790413_05872 [Deinococcus hopiensis KR-140]